MPSATASRSASGRSFSRSRRSSAASARSTAASRLQPRRPDRARVADDGSGGGASFTPGSALHDAGRVLAVTAGVIVIAAAALVPVVLLALLAWPLARASAAAGARPRSTAHR